MRLLFMLTFCLFAITAVGQTSPVSDKVNVVYEKDAKKLPAGIQPKYFLDSVLIGSCLPLFSQEEIKNIHVSTDSKIGEVYVMTKNPGVFRFMTLEEIKNKYVKSPSPATLYMIDNDLVKGNIANLKIDENYILNINILSESDFGSLKGAVKDIDIIKITTKSKENLERADQVYIRGTEFQAGL
ncbi:hypothetical protein [Pedobacter sp. V48]|uniref:hypothetical protein n=1 Tax=Pedobacter sp. V48 TaxID=509635 RepID=UPI0004B4FA75|nr:hypothetical protein [Pedobacter sp. V48]